MGLCSDFNSIISSLMAAVTCMTAQGETNRRSRQGEGTGGNPHPNSSTGDKMWEQCGECLWGHTEGWKGRGGRLWFLQWAISARVSAPEPVVIWFCGPGGRGQSSGWVCAVTGWSHTRFLWGRRYCRQHLAHLQQDRLWWGQKHLPSGTKGTLWHVKYRQSPLNCYFCQLLFLSFDLLV